MTKIEVRFDFTPTKADEDVGMIVDAMRKLLNEFWMVHGFQRFKPDLRIEVVYE